MYKYHLKQMSLHLAICDSLKANVKCKSKYYINANVKGKY